ncbi:hypothetical protein [Haloplanus sp.]|uniref:hypothetical protein n=1 Tax=Haloplanus sp. TaxID=1961696 RepID=UPI0026138C58|nr:hypothetical protein [Haloplanus sp.]
MDSGLAGLRGVGELSPQRRAELLLLGAYMALILGGAIPVFEMLVRAWQSWGHVRIIIQGAINATGLAPALFYYAPVGLYVGLGLALVADSYKRAQGVIFWIGILLGSVFVLASRTELLGTLFGGMGPSGTVAFLVFVGIGLRAAGVTTDVIDDDPPYEFNRAPRLLFVVTLAAIVIGFLDFHIDYRPVVRITPTGLTTQTPRLWGLNPSHAFTDAVFGVMCLAGLYKFTSYESDVKVIQIGPARSGKSAGFGGLHLTVEEFRDEDAWLKSSDDVLSLRDDIVEGEFPEPTRNRAGLQWLEIEYNAGVLFPEKLFLQSIDYGGALLGDVLANVRSDTKLAIEERASNWTEARRQVDRVNRRLMEQEGETDGGEVVKSDEIASAVWDCVRHADRIILTIPLDDFLKPIIENGTEMEYIEVVRDDGSRTEAELRSALDLTESQYLPNPFEYDGGLFYLPDRDEFRDHPSDYVTWYRDLMKHEGFEDTEFTYAVTKADLALRDYRAAEREHGNHNPLPLRNYDDFRHHVVDIVHDASNLLSQDFDEPEEFWPLWYEVEDPDGVGGDEPRITTADMDTIPVLRGSEQLLTKLER